MPDAGLRPLIKKKQLADWGEVDAATQTANNAVSAADNATQTANAATQTAQGATQTANAATQTAQGATQTANAATQTAQTATQTANAATQTAQTATQTANAATQTAAAAINIAEAGIKHYLRPEKEITQADFETPGGDGLGGTITLEEIKKFSVVVNSVGISEIGDVEVFENGILSNKPTITMLEDGNKDTTITVSGLNNDISVGDLFVVKVGVTTLAPLAPEA